MDKRSLLKCILSLAISSLIIVSPSCSPPRITTSIPQISPTKVSLGQPVSIVVNVYNSEKRGVEYTLDLKVNDSKVETKSLIINGGENQTIGFQYTPQSLGTYNVDVNGQIAKFDAVKPAHFDFGAITVAPESPEANQEFNASVEVTNDGDLPGTYVAVLKVDNAEVSSHPVDVEPGQTATACAVYTPNTSGTYVIEFCGAKKDVQVKGASIITPSPTIVPPVTQLFTYTSKDFYYQVSYPPNFDVKDSDAYTVLIEGTTGGIAVLVDRLPVDMSPKAYFDLISSGKKKQLPTWTSTSETEIKENDVTIGYKYDYSNMVGDKNWIGKGMVFKKGGFGFYVVFTTPESYWEANKDLAIRCLDSFVLPRIATGSYSNSALNISLILPNGWSLIETGSTSSLLEFFPPYDQQLVTGYLYIKTVAAGTTAQEYLVKIVAGAGSSVSQNPFSFSNSVMGYEITASREAIAVSGTSIISLGTSKLRYIALASSNRMYYFRFEGTSTTMDAQANTISQLARSLVVSSP